MPTPPLDPKVVQKVIELLKDPAVLDHREISRRAGCSKGSVGNIADKHGLTGRVKPASPPQEYQEPAKAEKTATRTDDIKDDSWTISLPSTRISSLDQMIEFCKIDLQIWEVERFVCNKWEVGMKPPATTEYVKTEDGRTIPAWVRFENEPIIEALYQVKVWLKKKAPAVLAIKSALDEFKREAAKHSPLFFPKIVKMRSKYSTGVWVEHSIVDHHFGALIWDKETGSAPYDLSIAKSCWRDAIAANCDRTDAYKPEGILFPIGNDQQNADNRQGTTENLTPQSMDSRYQKVTRVSRGETMWAIDQFLARYGKVHVIPVPGNHDPLSTFHLGDYLAAWYRNDKRVTVDTRPLFRKYWELGVVGLGFLHGNKGKLERYGMTFASEEPKMWGRTKWREIHSADKHQRSLIEFDGYAVRILPSLRPPCAWSSENMLGAVRASESYVWSKTEGLIGNATFSILPNRG